MGVAQTTPSPRPPEEFNMASSPHRRSCAQEMAREANYLPSPSAPRPPSPEQEYDFIKEPPGDFLCAVTLELLLEPYQTSCCGHHLSREVVERLKRERKPCPMCQIPNFDAHPDKYLRRKVRELHVRCPYKAGACEWVGDLGNREAHIRNCPKQPWRCQHCGLSGLREVAQRHVKECERLPVPCPNGCSMGQVPRCELSKHIEQFCPLQEVVCPYSHVACTVRLPRTEMEMHVQNYMQHHLLLMCSTNLDLSRQMNEKVSQKEAQIRALEAQVARMGDKLGEKVEALEARLVAQGEWMESQQTPEEESQSEKENSDEKTAELLKEAVEKAVATAMRGLEERMLGSLRDAKESESSAKMADDERQRAMLEDMALKQAESMRKMEGKVDAAVTRMEQNQAQALSEMKKQEIALKEMEAKQETALKQREQQQRMSIKETEILVLEQVRASQRNVETVVAREMREEAGRRGEEVRREVGGLGERVGKVEGRMGIVEQKLTREFGEVKTHLRAIGEKTDRVEGSQRAMEGKIANEMRKEIAKEQRVLADDIKRDVAAKAGEVRVAVENQVVEMGRKLEDLSKVIQEKATNAQPVSPKPHVHRQHKAAKQSASHPIQASLPRLTTFDEPDEAEKIAFQMSASPASAQPSSKAIGEEDANRQQPKVTTGVHRPLPQEYVKVAEPSPQVRKPPCDFEIERFSKLKEQNKEWRSPPFYSKLGYKMCLGLWPNGFRSGAGTHVSVEFYKMRDANTDKLKWNVKLPIHVRMFNYRTKKWEREHINGDTFTRSKVSGEFETSGYAQSHKLIAHDELEPYLLKDTFRIQVYKFEVKQ